MVRADSFIESSSASSQVSLLQGLALAVGLHIALLAIQPGFFGFIKNGPSPLRVSIQLEKINIGNNPTDVLELEPQSETLKQPENLDFRPQIIVAEAIVSDPKRELKPRIQLSTSGAKFKRFLQSETDRNIEIEQNELSQFSATFELYFEAPETTLKISYRESQGALGGGQFKVYKNGKVTCVLSMVPLSFDDHVYGAGGGAKDCSPKKKLDLKIRKNTRE